MFNWYIQSFGRGQVSRFYQQVYLAPCPKCRFSFLFLFKVHFIFKILYFPLLFSLDSIVRHLTSFLCKSMFSNHKSLYTICLVPKPAPLKPHSRRFTKVSVNKSLNRTTAKKAQQLYSSVELVDQLVADAK